MALPNCLPGVENRFPKSLVQSWISDSHWLYFQARFGFASGHPCFGHRTPWMARTLPPKLVKGKGEVSISDCKRAGANTMRKGSPSKSGIELLLEKYAAIFRTPENLNHYSKEDYQAAERKFLKYALENGNVFLRERISNP